MKVAIITDQHFGARNDSPHFLDYYQKFYDETFFPKIEELGITTVLILGDTFDRRKYVNFYTLKRSKEMFFDKLANLNIRVHMLAGNHDTYFKNTNDVNSVRLLLKEYENIEVIDKPTTIWLDNEKYPICMMPWICAENHDDSMFVLSDTDADIVMGHFEIAGFAMNRGIPNYEGLDPSIFKRFDMVFSGHFHHRSNSDNIRYLGNPYELTWQDYNDPRGFHVFDTETRELTFIPNQYTMFNKLHYDDSRSTLSDLMDTDFEQFRDTYVKVIVHAKTNPYWFDLVIERLEKANIADLQVVEDHFNLDLEADDDIINEAEDTISIIHKFIDGMNINTDRKRVENIIQNLYIEAHDIL